MPVLLQPQTADSQSGSGTGHQSKGEPAQRSQLEELRRRVEEVNGKNEDLTVRRRLHVRPGQGARLCHRLTPASPTLA